MEIETLLLFDDYVRGTLEGSVRKDLEARLRSDKDLKREFDNYVNIVIGINEFERERLKKVMKDPKVVFMHKNSSRKWILGLAGAAAILLVLLIPGYIIYRTTTYPSRLANEYYIKDAGLAVTMGAGVNPLLDQAMIEYKDSNFDQSLKKLGQLLASTPLNDTLNYYAGVCCYEMNDLPKAIEYFQKLISKESPYYFQAKYDLSLAFIKSKDLENARKALKEVSAGEAGPLKEKAGQLLEKL
jgi:FimV-like protein